MKLKKLIFLTIFGVLSVPVLQSSFYQANATADRPLPSLRSRVEASPALPYRCEPFVAIPPAPSWESGTVSGVAIGKDGNVYEIQRGDRAAPVLVLDPAGHVLRSWGTGSYTTPHSIRLDDHGNVWTVDATSSAVIKYSSAGKRLLMIHVGGQPSGEAFNGATDIAFGPGGNLFVSDGYGNARIVEYTSDGKLLRNWGSHGSGPGEFNLPHAIQVEDGIVYVADRENGRIEMFDLKGKCLGEINGLGRIYSFKRTADLIWASMGSFDQPPGSPGAWVVEFDLTGKILGHVDISEPLRGHALDVSPSGDLFITAKKYVVRCTANPRP